MKIFFGIKVFLGLYLKGFLKQCSGEKGWFEIERISMKNNLRHTAIGHVVEKIAKNINKIHWSL